jgi:hypothetical protein
VCLRDSGGGCSFGAVQTDELSRAAFRKEGSHQSTILMGPKPPATPRALAGARARVNGERLAGRVILELVSGQLEADEMLEGRVGDG